MADALSESVVGRRPAAARARAPGKPKRRKRRKTDPGRAWTQRLQRTRPGLVPFVLDALAGLYDRPTFERRLDPTSELVLTILTQNTADVNAETAFVRLREAYPSGGAIEV